jgi:hypothetical protein
MPLIRRIDMQIIDKIFRMEDGYVLDFSNRTMSQFFNEDLNIDIDHEKYREDGTSKARRLRCFLRKADVGTAVHVLKTLWEYREARRTLTGEEERVANAHAQLIAVLNRIEGKPSQPASPQSVSPAPVEKPDYAGLLGELMGMHSIEPQRRGYAFEAFLKRLFNAFGLLPGGGFRTTGEQIDGSFVLAGETYLLEAKWQNAMTSAADLREFQGKLDARMTWARGLFVSYTGFTADGLIAYGRGGSVICMDGLDLHDAFKGEIPLNNVLEQKVRRSVETGEVLARVRDLFPTAWKP